EPVDELLERAQLLQVHLVHGRRLSCGRLFGIRRHAGRVEDILLDVDRRLDAHRHGYRVAGAGVDLNMAPVAVHDDAREERLFAQVVHDDLRDLGAQLVDDRFHQVVRARPCWRHSGHRAGNRPRFQRADPDKEIALGRFVLEDHYAVLGGQADANALDNHLDHYADLRNEPQKLLYPASWWVQDSFSIERTV